MVDLYVTVTDENGDELGQVNIYQDGSDSEATEAILNSIRKDFSTFQSCDDEHDGQPDEAQEWHDFDPDC
jgi:hypothetical protein